MKILLIFLAVSTLAYEQIDGVLQLNRKDFDKAKEEFPYLVVKFYQDGCPYCQQIKPVYIELAKRLSDYGYAVAEVNVDENKVLSAKQGIKAYPTIKLYSKGRVIECPNSAEQSEFIFEYILQNTYDTQTLLDGAEDIYYFLKRNNIAILTYVDHDIADIPKKFPRIKFGLLPVQSQTSDTEKKTIHIYNKKFAEKKTYKGPVKDLADFINQNAFPRVFTFTEEEFEKAQTDQTKIIALVTEDKELAERFSQVSEEFSNNLRFVVINQKEALPPQRFQHLARFPLKDRFIYAYDYQEFKVRQLPLKSDDVEDIKALITTLSGEETKEEVELTKKALFFQNDGQVHEFTQGNWDVQANQNDNHVFVYFYAPWCGHCKSLAPIIQELATNIQATQPDVIVGKIDATQHKIDGFNVEGYPTIYLIRKVDGKVENIKYEGARTLNAMANWLEKELPALPGQVIETVVFGPSNVTEVQSYNFDELVWNTDKHVFIWFYDPSNKQCVNLQEPMERLYHTFAHDPKILIARTDLTRNTFDLLKPTYVPSFFFITTENGERVFKRFETAKLYRTFKQYIEDNTGTQGVTIRGQYSNQGRVYTADIDNFDDLVLDSPQDVIVKFYAPWCTHCQNMADAYIDLAHNVRENPNILVVEMDWTEQKTSKVEVKGFPTIILFKKDKNPVGEQNVRQIVYQGPREAKFMEDFIKDHQPVYNADL